MGNLDVYSICVLRHRAKLPCHNCIYYDNKCKKLIAKYDDIPMNVGALINKNQKEIKHNEEE